MKKYIIFLNIINIFYNTTPQHPSPTPQKKKGGTPHDLIWFDHWLKLILKLTITTLHSLIIFIIFIFCLFNFNLQLKVNQFSKAVKGVGGL